jgi:hypothetical protein
MTETHPFAEFFDLAKQAYEHSTSAGIDVIHEGVECLMTNGRIDLLDMMADHLVHTQTSNDDIILSFLVATLPCRSQLHWRGVLFEQYQEKHANEPDLWKGLE